MIVPRDWNFVRSQNYAQQIRDTAIPNATGARFKAGAFCLVIPWLTVLFSLRHSIRHYKPRHRGIVGKAMGFLQAVPLRLLLLICLSAAMIAYQMAIAFRWDLSVVVAVGANVPVVMAWGYGPPVLVLYVQIAYGFAAPNEDKELIRQRRERGETNDRELGIVRKPAWWRRVRGDHLRSMRDKIHQNVNEVGGKRGVGRRAEDAAELQIRLEAERSAVNHGDDGLEMGRLPGHANVGGRDGAGAANTHAERVLQHAAGLLFPNAAARAAARSEDGPPPPYPTEEGRPRPAPRSNSASTTRSIHAQPQQVKSMLDV